MAIITKLSIRDTLRISAVDIEPNGATVTLGGKHAAGKSSILKSILLGLQGKTALGKNEKITKPIRDGAKKGIVKIEIAELDLVVTLTHTPSTEKLVLTTMEGMVYPGAPRERLAKLLQVRTFNPMSFATADEAKQTEMLMGFLGLDFADLDAQHKRVYDQRSDVNRKGRDLKGVVAKLPHHKDAPSEEVSVKALVGELEKREAIAAQHDYERHELAEAEREFQEAHVGAAGTSARIVGLERELEQLRQALDARNQELDAQQEHVDKLKAEVDAQVWPDLDEVKTQIAESESINRKVRANQHRATEQKELDTLKTQSDALTAALEANRTERRKRVAAADFPVDGLGFADDGAVTLNGIPFSQSSHTEQNEVSAAFMANSNPTLSVFLLPDASTLDEEGLAFMADLAKKQGCQLWLEDCRTTDPDAFIIEDGHIRGAKPAEGETA